VLLGFDETKSNVMDVEFVMVGTSEVIVVVGGTVSTVQVYVADWALTVPASLIPTTLKE
jgi:hypothetical protein